MQSSSGLVSYYLEGLAGLGFSLSSLSSSSLLFHRYFYFLHDLRVLFQPLFLNKCKSYLSSTFATPALSRTEYVKQTTDNVHRKTFTFIKHFRSCPHPAESRPQDVDPGQPTTHRRDDHQLFKKMTNLGKSLVASTLTCPAENPVSKMATKASILASKSPTGTLGEKRFQAPPWVFDAEQAEPAPPPT